MFDLGEKLAHATEFFVALVHQRARGKLGEFVERARRTAQRCDPARLFAAAGAAGVDGLHGDRHRGAADAGVRRNNAFQTLTSNNSRHNFRISSFGFFVVAAAAQAD